MWWPPGATLHNHFGKLSRISASWRTPWPGSTLELREQRFTELSDGKPKQVLLARALCQQPGGRLDRPTSYLDIRHKIELDILREMTASRGCRALLHGWIWLPSWPTWWCRQGQRHLPCGAPEDVLDDTIRQLYDIHDGGSQPAAGQRGAVRRRAAGIRGARRGPLLRAHKRGSPLPPGSSSGVTWTGRWRRPWPPAGI